MDKTIAKLYLSKKTILTSRDLAILWKETNPNNLKSKIAYYVKQEALIRLTRGVFAKDKNYNPRELATSIYTPSYISFETALRDAGIIFQHYDTIFVAGPWSKTINIGSAKITFRRLKDIALFSPAGIDRKDNYSIASPERAFLDTIYLSHDYFFDNLRPLNWERCFALAKIYHNRQLLKRLQSYHQHYAP